MPKEQTLFTFDSFTHEKVPFEKNNLCIDTCFHFSSFKDPLEEQTHLLLSCFISTLQTSLQNLRSKLTAELTFSASRAESSQKNSKIVADFQKSKLIFAQFFVLIPIMPSIKKIRKKTWKIFFSW